MNYEVMKQPAAAHSINPMALSRIEYAQITSQIVQAGPEFIQIVKLDLYSINLCGEV